MKTRHCQTLIIGASFYGCGMAAIRPGSLVLEESPQVGSDFVFTFNPGCDWDAPLLHPFAEEFRNSLLKSRVLTSGLLQCGALAPFFSQWCLDRRLNVELLSRVIQVGENKVLVLSPAGKGSVTADKIIDARPRPGIAKRVTALLSCSRPPASPIKYGVFEVIPGIHETEAYLRMEVPSSITWPEARERIHHAWLERSSELKEWKLTLIGTRYDYGNFRNPALALDAGLNA